MRGAEPVATKGKGQDARMIGKSKGKRKGGKGKAAVKWDDMELDDDDDDDE